MGRRPHLQGEVPHAGKPKARWRRGQQHQEACLKVLPAKDRTRPHRTVPALGERGGAAGAGRSGATSARCQMLVVQVPLANERPPFQGVSGMENAAVGSVGGGAEGNQEVEEQVDGPGSAG